MIGLGYLLDKKFDMKITTLTKINFYLFVPAFSFVNLYQTDIEIDALKALAVTILILIANYTLSFFLAKVRGYENALKYAFQNAVMFYNSGNIGIPLITLVFSTGAYLIGDEAPYLSLALAIQVMVLVIQNVSVNTFGYFNAGRAQNSIKKAFLKMLTLPTVYLVPLAFLLKLVPYDITNLPIWPVFVYAKNGLVPIALLTLGMQLSKSRFRLDNHTVYLAVFTRLVVGPMLALLFIWLFRLDGIVAQVLFISASVPSAVNTALVAVENDNHPNFATQVVIFSTLLSSLTMTGVIYLARVFFPV